MRAVEMAKKDILKFTNKETVECSGSTKVSGRFNTG